jgi:predicted MFS family arabinose efflux permease
MAEAAGAVRTTEGDESRLLVSAILLGVVGPEVFIVQPGFVQGMVQYLGFDDRAAGYVASAEMFGIAATTVAMTFAAHRFNWRRVIAWSLAIMVVANIASTLVRGADTFAALRFAAGVGAGGLISLSFAAIGLTRRPDRNFGYLIMWVLTYGALALLAMPTAYGFAGFRGVLWFFALFPLIALPWLKYFPASGENAVQVGKDAVDLPGASKGLALAAMFAYFLGQGVVWAYLFLIGIAGGLSEQQVANGLTVSQFAGIAGALGAALTAGRYGRAVPLAAGIVAGAVTLYFLVGQFSAMLYLVAVSVYNLAWNFTHPYLLGAMASFDRRGRVVVNAVAMQMLGLAIGPSLAASVIEEGIYVNVNLLGGALFLLSAALILPPVFSQSRLVRAPQAA